MKVPGQVLWELAGRPAIARFSVAIIPASPQIYRRGSFFLEVTSLTPVSCRGSMDPDGRRHMYTAPCDRSLSSALATSLAPRIGLKYRNDEVPVEVLSSRTQLEEIPFGGKFGNLRGWSGSVILKTNAIGAWLLLAAGAGLGLGGRVACGFGAARVKLMEEAEIKRERNGWLWHG